jgi:hypothetical protein
MSNFDYTETQPTAFDGSNGNDMDITMVLGDFSVNIGQQADSSPPAFFSNMTCVVNEYQGSLTSEPSVSEENEVCELKLHISRGS